MSAPDPSFTFSVKGEGLTQEPHAQQRLHDGTGIPEGQLKAGEHTLESTPSQPTLPIARRSTDKQKTHTHRGYESTNRLASRGDSGWWGPHSKTCDDPVVIKAVYFDGDQTLWDFEVMMRRSLAATLTQLQALRPGIRTEDLDVESVVADREAVAKELRGTETNLERIRLAAFSRTLSRLGLQDDDLAEQMNAYYLQHRFDNVELFPEVVDTLAVLSRSYVLGLLSNGNGYPERSGLGGTFASVVFSQDHGVEKPDRRLFDVAAAEVGCEPDEVVMVGDSLPNDVSGAQNAGWRAIWLNRDGRDRPDRYTPDAEISSLAELPKALRALQTLPTTPAARP